MPGKDYVEIIEDQIIEVHDHGPMGPPGPPGPAGNSYVHSQALASMVWSVAHNLNMFPNVTTVDSANHQIVGEIEYLDGNTLTITFTSPESGKAYVS